MVNEWLTAGEMPDVPSRHMWMSRQAILTTQAVTRANTSIIMFII
jgi:hypothetical protein